MPPCRRRLLPSNNSMAQFPYPAAIMLALGACAQAPAESGQFARDGNIAIQEEYDAAAKAASVAAWDLFIARHPDHSLTRKAKAKRAELLRKTR
jgi:hypothetical protein